MRHERLTQVVLNGVRAAADIQIAISVKSTTAANILTARAREDETESISNALIIVNNLLMEIGNKTKNLQGDSIVIVN
jgi:hypothetical protein